MAIQRVLVINSEHMGRGANELGARLMASFLRKLCSEVAPPERIVFYNTGVRLLGKASAVLDAMEILARRGVDLVACGTCCTFFELGDSLPYGRISDMQEIATTLLTAPHVTTL